MNMQAVGRAIDRFRARRRATVDTETLGAPRSVTVEPHAVADERSEEPTAVATVTDLEDRWCDFRQRLAATSQQYDSLIADQRARLHSKDKEIERLKDALDDLWGIAVAQLEAIRRADDERQAKDKQVAQLLVIVARHQKSQVGGFGAADEQLRSSQALTSLTGMTDAAPADRGRLLAAA